MQNRRSSPSELPEDRVFMEVGIRTTRLGDDIRLLFNPIEVNTYSDRRKSDQLRFHLGSAFGDDVYSIDITPSMIRDLFRVRFVSGIKIHLNFSDHKLTQVTLTPP